jgi:hypothetical protein
MLSTIRYFLMSRKNDMIGSVVRTNDLVAFLIQKALVGLIIVDLFHSCQIWSKMWSGLLGIQINLWITELISKRYHFRKKIKKNDWN